MTRTLDFNGILVQVVNPMLGQGGQGVAQQVALSSDTGIGLVAKSIPSSPEAKVRTKALVDKMLPFSSPYLAAPIAINDEDENQIMHLAPFAIGNDLENDEERSFAEHMEQALLLSCLVTILEEHGLAHGDLAPSNIIIGNDGSIHLIDFDNYSSVDVDIPLPQMRGQDMMLAPELRNDGKPPTIESDRFAAGILNAMLVLRRHPTDSLVSTPAEFGIEMSTGLWPERRRTPITDEVPIEAMGDDLCSLFDMAFSLNPSERPTADEWRRAFIEALQNMMIHDCGQAFVLSDGQTHCPWCRINIEADTSVDIGQLKITVPSIGSRYSVVLQDGNSIVLGRGNLGGHASSVSSRHLELTPFGDRLHLRHVGRHPTAIERNGQWFNLQEVWIDKSELHSAPLTLRLADLDIQIGV